MSIAIIVAASENNVIGSDNQMPWRLSNDLKRFKELTMGGAVIMGRKTYDSIGRPLPGRKNIVLTNSNSFAPADVTVVHSVEEALREAATAEKVFVMGGGEIYRLFWSVASKIYFTRVHAHLEGDTYIPAITKEEWQQESNESFPADEKNSYPYSYETYHRK
ncbi:dihydrofolate reductase [Bacteroides sp. 214]|uniref:dihydrofolate reductase n=1 Tax=Bacteroides sp. 214 TaxID=2302935 RepID=UPI0013D73DB8|nr:dihydrofolate reductase [Bacteroides sp. 214]NDW12086.1 dihydrofolate reductase [Bacteroides sp. 214]